MALYTLDPADRTELARRLAAGGHVAAFALCAAWCTTCREFRVACERIAESHPELSLVWVDIEDDAALVGDVDVETFPTLAIFEGDTLRHYGAILPKAELLERMIGDLGTLTSSDAPDEIAGLVAALRG
jgi:thioredoxin reductase (NADPH)